MPQVTVGIATGAGVLSTGVTGSVVPTGQSAGCERSAPLNESCPITTSPIAGVSGLYPCWFRKSSAYQSLHASPIDADWNVSSAPNPSGYTTRRPDRPCVYSW